MRSIGMIKATQRTLIRKKYILNETQNYKEGKKNKSEFVKLVSYYLKKNLFIYKIYIQFFILK
jgi:hypothetical protein